MLRAMLIGGLFAALAAAAGAAAPDEFVVQGLYEGTCKGPSGEKKLEARVVALGKAAYKVYVREVTDKGTTALAEMDGKTAGDAVTFAGKAGEVEWSASYADGALKGACGKGGVLELKKVVKTPPTLGAKPPAGAIVLLSDGKDMSAFALKAGKDGKAAEVKLTDDGCVVVPKGGLTTKQKFPGSFDLHVEFKNPFMPTARGQGRGNSGVYLPTGDEIQVLDSFGMDTYKGGGCGGLYKYKDPDAFDKFSLASLPPGQWQTYDVQFRIEKKDGKPTGKARVTVLHNGIKIHDNAELSRAAKGGGFYFQDHGNPVQYRNIWVLPVKDE